MDKQEKQKYTKMNAIEKLFFFQKHLSLSTNCLSKILEMDESDVINILKNQDTQLNENSLFSIRNFISIGSYLLKITKYTTEEIPVYWNKNELYQFSKNKPPWHELGLSGYLSKTGSQGINESLAWIRTRNLRR